MVPASAVPATSGVSHALDQLARSLQTRPKNSALGQLSPLRLLMVWESLVFSLVQWQAVKRKWLLVSEADLVLLRVLLGVLLYERGCRGTAFPSGAGGLTQSEPNVARRQHRMQRHTQLRSVLKLVNEVELFFLCVFLVKNLLGVHFLTPLLLAFNRSNYQTLVTCFDKAFAAVGTMTTHASTKLDIGRFDLVFQAFFAIQMFVTDTTMALAVPTYFHRHPCWLSSDTKLLHYLTSSGGFTRTYLQTHSEVFIGLETSWQLPTEGLAAEIKSKTTAASAATLPSATVPASAAASSTVKPAMNGASTSSNMNTYHILSYECDKGEESLLVYIEL